MAISSIKTAAELGASFVLAPERYDPRRFALDSTSSRNTKRICDVATVAKNFVKMGLSEMTPALVLDTSHASYGLVVHRAGTIPVSEIGSMKKLIEPGNVIISRLRPYLRQVAFVDSKLPGLTKKTLIIGSTEFFVLRSLNAESIAYLVPFLLSDEVQNVLAASQEGGHHPRFNEDVLTELPLPIRLWKHRQEISEKVEKSVTLFRDSEKLMKEALEELL